MAAYSVAERCPEAFRLRERQRNHLRHRSFLAEEVLGSGGSKRASVEQKMERRDSRPVVGPVYQVVLHRIAKGVGHLVDDVVGIDEADDAGLLGRPEVLPATVEGVLTLGEELVEMLDERRVAAVGVVDARMMMIAHRDGEEHANAESLRGDCEAIDERVVGLAVRPHQELPLGAAARDHVRTPGVQHAKR
jgi:hypothetical protein